MKCEKVNISKWKNGKSEKNQANGGEKQMNAMFVFVFSIFWFVFLVEKKISEALIAHHLKWKINLHTAVTKFYRFSSGIINSINLHTQNPQTTIYCSCPVKLKISVSSQLPIAYHESLLHYITCIGKYIVMGSCVNICDFLVHIHGASFHTDTLCACQCMRARAYIIHCVRSGMVLMCWCTRVCVCDCVGSVSVRVSSGRDECNQNKNNIVNNLNAQYSHHITLDMHMILKRVCSLRVECIVAFLMPFSLNESNWICDFYFCGEKNSNLM